MSLAIAWTNIVVSSLATCFMCSAGEPNEPASEEQLSDDESKKSDSQTVSFTTKDIREREPQLIEYIKVMISSS